MAMKPCLPGRVHLRNAEGVCIFCEQEIKPEESITHMAIELCRRCGRTFGEHRVYYDPELIPEHPGQVADFGFAWKSLGVYCLPVESDAEAMAEPPPMPYGQD